MTLVPTDRPHLLRGVRVVADRVRGGEVLLAPEKAMALDATGAAILARVDGTATLAEIVSALAAAYDAPADRIAGDVQDFLATLRDRVYLGVTP